MEVANVEEAFRLLYALSLMTNVQTMKNQSSNPLSSSIIFSDTRRQVQNFCQNWFGFIFRGLRLAASETVENVGSKGTS